ncbi:MAG: endonuclease/exonuclease/phosphatase family protein [Aquabacterium sp.]
MARRSFSTGRGTALAVAAVLWAGAASAQSPLIGQIQGESHRSALADTRVNDVWGIVTAVDTNGFWIQDLGDGNGRTSDGVYVFRGRTGTKASVGDAVRVSGQVQEFRPGNSATNLTTTEINASSGFNGNWSRLSTGNALPLAQMIGAGFAPPTAIAPLVGNVETAPGYRLDPSRYSMDFYEALEGMRVGMGSALTVSSSRSFGEIAVIASDLAWRPGVVTSPRGGVVVGPGQFNGHRLILDDRMVATPTVHSGATLSGVVGVMDYSFENYKLLLTQSAAVVSNPLQRETATIGGGRFGLASLNVENLGGNATQQRFDAIAGQVAQNLGAPQLIALQEVQDNNGATNDGVVAADVTLARLASAVSVRTGRDYRFITVNPVDDADGGQPGGNIRQAFLYDASRVSFAGVVGGALDAVAVASGPGGQVSLNLDAGRIDPTNAAFDNSRKPLVVQLQVDGMQLIVINNHFNSKGGDEPLYGPEQPPDRVTEAQRLAQAQAVATFVQQVLALNPHANVVVTGDFNDFQFADTLNPLTAAGLVNLTSLLPEGERYSYNFEGNLQALDHMFVSANLLSKGDLVYDIVHANAEFADGITDHDPLLLTLNMPQPVPEPAAVVMLLAGCALLGPMARRRRRS